VTRRLFPPLRTRRSPSPSTILFSCSLPHFFFEMSRVKRRPVRSGDQALFFFSPLGDIAVDVRGRILPSPRHFCPFPWSPPDGHSARPSSASLFPPLFPRRARKRGGLEDYFSRDTFLLPSQASKGQAVGPSPPGIKEDRQLTSFSRACCFPPL